MKNKMWKQYLILGLTVILAAGIHAQQPTSFQRIGSQDQTFQDLFPGSFRARPVAADFTNNGSMGLFYGGQDTGANSSSRWYLKEVNKDTRWGDQGDGTYVNPILNADYSDPDVIRVGDKYYMVASDFHFIGMQVLESADMINWKLISQVYDRLNFSQYDTNDRYGGGSWAPAIRYHDGKFWIFFCTPNEGLFMANATDPAGTWSALLNVKNVSGWEDPCPLWDDNGNAYLGRSQLGGGPIIIHKMSADGTQLLDNGTTVYDGPTSEGTKLFKKEGYYYISIPEGGVSTGWQTVLRSSNIYGPYEKKTVLEQGTTKVNGPHQGALVDTPNGEWWFYHFQSKDPQGRIVHLQPVTWKDGFPEIGVDLNMNGIGEPVKEYTKPNTGQSSEIFAPQTNDEFSSVQKGLQWQFNHNPTNTSWSLTERPGYLVIKAQKANSLKSSKNMFTQKTMGYYGEASTELDCSKLTAGQRAGLFNVGNKYNAIGVQKTGGKNYIYVEMDGTVEQIKELSSGTTTVYFKVFLNANMNKHQFYYSLDNVEFVACKAPYALQSGDWKGTRVGIFTYNITNSTGQADFNWFHYDYDGPGNFFYEEEDVSEPADWHMWNELAALVKNNGDGTFTVVQEYDANMQQSIWTNSVFFDYDNDGNLDLLLIGKGGDWRFSMSQQYARLYRNLGEKGNYLFQEISNTGLKQYCDEEYLGIISVGDFDHDGYNDLLIMSKEDNGNRSINLYKNKNGSGRFELQTNALPASYKPTANGSVMFGDIDNDGWLDVFHNGWSDIPQGIGLYKNMQNGTFQDITPTTMQGSWQSQSVLADVNGDGTLDILITGHGDNWARYSDLWYNTINPGTKQATFTFVNSTTSGIEPINMANILVADFNNDGRMDMIMKGYDGQKDLTKVYYQNALNKFILDTTYPILSIKNGGINMGDINGDGNMDVVIAGEKGSDTGSAYSSPVRIYENHPENSGLPKNQPPSPPPFVDSELKGGKLYITWGESTDALTSQQALRYNIYVKNNDTGKIWMMIPADPATGRIKVGTDLQISLSSQVKEYVMTINEPGDYTVGVQALDQAYAGSRFTTSSPYAPDYIVDTPTKTWTEYKNDYGNSIIFKEGGQLTGIPGTQTVNGVVKIEKTFTANQWYPIGFPFNIASVRSNKAGFDNYDLETYNPASVPGNRGDYWLRTYDNTTNKFSDYTYASKAIEKGGYALQVPANLNGASFTFTSVPYVTLSNSTEFDVLSGDYKLTHNPSVANVDVANDATNSYYAFEYTGQAGNYGLLASNYTVKPFESVVVANQIIGPLHSSLSVDAINSLPAFSTEAIATEYYNLQGMRVMQLQKGSVYIVKSIHESGKTEVTKQIK